MVDVVLLNWIELSYPVLPEVGTEQVRLLEVDGVDPVDGDELLDLDGLVALGLERLELFVAQHHVLPARVLVALDGLAAFDHVAARAADVLLLQPRLVGLV